MIHLALSTLTSVLLVALLSPIANALPFLTISNNYLDHFQARFARAASQIQPERRYVTSFTPPSGYRQSWGIDYYRLSYGSSSGQYITRSAISGATQVDQNAVNACATLCSNNARCNFFHPVQMDTDSDDKVICALYTTKQSKSAATFDAGPGTSGDWVISSYGFTRNASPITSSTSSSAPTSSTTPKTTTTTTTTSTTTTRSTTTTTTPGSARVPRSGPPHLQARRTVQRPPKEARQPQRRRRRLKAPVLPLASAQLQLQPPAWPLAQLQARLEAPVRPLASAQTRLVHSPALPLRQALAAARHSPARLPLQVARRLRVHPASLPLPPEPHWFSIRHATVQMPPSPCSSTRTIPSTAPAPLPPLGSFSTVPVATSKTTSDRSATSSAMRASSLPQLLCLV